MIYEQATNWSLFQILCRVLGGRDDCALADSVTAGLLTQLVEMARSHDVLPALAVRCGERLLNNEIGDKPEGAILAQALRENTLRNMQITVQSLKLARVLNNVGITPVFLKGTAQLLASGSKNLGFRKQLDIDLLVDHEQLEIAAEALLNDGYRFYAESNDHAVPMILHNIQSAIAGSGAHHHLPELIKDDCIALVELHRHYLPRRFQRRTSLRAFFSTAVPQNCQKASFLVPAAEYQLVHLILGKLVHDGHLARRSFPLREACDYIHILEAATGNCDFRLVMQHCGKYGELFSKLVGELMAYGSEANCYGVIPDNKLERYKSTIQRRFSSNTLRNLLDAYARTLHLTHSIIHSPAKLPAYLSRLG